jgi:uncharacterized protein YabN with tetrapyrrole methylase and pyrophosphatase domain
MEQKILELDSTISKTMEKCPWTKNQTFNDLIKYTKEELDEVIEALDKNDNDNLEEEIGDLLFTILLLGRVLEQNNKISLEKSIERVNKKIIERSPHVFGDKKATTLKEALELWNSV